MRLCAQDLNVELLFLTPYFLGFISNFKIKIPKVKTFHPTVISIIVNMIGIRVDERLRLINKLT